MSKGPIMILAGGTGGHVFPGLAVAKEISKSSVSVVWMGTRKGLEAKVVPEEGIEVEQRRLPSGRGRPQHHGGWGGTGCWLTMAPAPARVSRSPRQRGPGGRSQRTKLVRKAIYGTTLTHGLTLSHLYLRSTRHRGI